MYYSKQELQSSLATVQVDLDAIGETHLERITKESNELEQALYWYSINKELHDSENQIEAAREQVHISGARLRSLLELFQIASQLKRSEQPVLYLAYFKIP